MVLQSISILFWKMSCVLPWLQLLLKHFYCMKIYCNRVDSPNSCLRIVAQRASHIRGVDVVLTSSVVLGPSATLLGHQFEFADGEIEKWCFSRTWLHVAHYLTTAWTILSYEFSWGVVDYPNLITFGICLKFEMEFGTLTNAWQFENAPLSSWWVRTI